MNVKWKESGKNISSVEIEGFGWFFSTFSFVFLLLLRFQFLLSTQLKHRPTSSADLPISVNGNSVAFIAPAKTPGIMRGFSPSCLTSQWLNPVGSSFKMPPLSFLPSPLPSDPADHHHCLSYWKHPEWSSCFPHHSSSMNTPFSSQEEPFRIWILLLPSTVQNPPNNTLITTIFIMVYSVLHKLALITSLKKNSLSPHQPH